MEAYPTDERGVPCAPEGIEECYEVCLKGFRSTNRHHLAYPRREYKTRLERSYREAASMIVRACMCKHEELHHTYDPPKMPDAAAMRSVLSGNPPLEQPVFIKSKLYVNMENVYEDGV